MGWICVFGCSNARVLFRFPAVRWLRMKWQEFIYTSTFESNLSSAFGFTSMSSTFTLSEQHLWHNVDYRKKKITTCPSFSFKKERKQIWVTVKHLQWKGIGPIH